jgi:NIMA (never in mitosis gene a)-related kinase
MKGLVLKILRGTYPPIPSNYSNDLRNLISEMLIKDPAKRPSIK